MDLREWVLLASLLFVACDSTSTHTSTSNNDSVDFSELVYDDGGWATSALSWPADLHEHPSAPIESRDWFVLLVDDRDDSVHSLVHRLSRASLRKKAVSSGAGSSSAWSFSSAMQVAGRWESSGTDADTWERTERVAADLATPADRWSAERPAARFNASLLDQQVLFQPTISEASDVCAGEWFLNVGDVVELRMQQQRCPSARATADTATSRSGPLPVQAVRVVDGDQRMLTGVAWMRHVWGRAPSRSGAVRYDSLVLTLRGLGTYEIIATRRLSGRGQAVVTASALGAAPSFVHEDASWHDSTSNKALLSGRSRLQIPSLAVDIDITPLVGDAVVDPDGRTRQTVVASGSHKGAGYLDAAVK